MVCTSDMFRGVGRRGGGDWEERTEEAKGEGRWGWWSPWEERRGRECSRASVRPRSDSTSARTWSRRERGLVGSVGGSAGVAAVAFMVDAVANLSDLFVEFGGF